MPEDGLPVLDDWITVCEGMMFGGVELGREPVDITVRGLVFKITPYKLDHSK